MLRLVDGILILVDGEVGAKEGREDGFGDRKGGKGGVAVEVEEGVVVVGRDADRADASLGELQRRTSSVWLLALERKDRKDARSSAEQSYPIGCALLDPCWASWASPRCC